MLIDGGRSSALHSCEWVLENDYVTTYPFLKSNACMFACACVYMCVCDELIFFKWGMAAVPLLVVFFKKQLISFEKHEANFAQA